MFAAVPGLVLYQAPLDSNEKHDGFWVHADAIKGKLRAMNIRRLPSWILSIAHHKAISGIHPDYEPLPMASIEEMAEDTDPGQRPPVDDRSGPSRRAMAALREHRGRRRAAPPRRRGGSKRCSRGGYVGAMGRKHLRTRRLADLYCREDQRHVPAQPRLGHSRARSPRRHTQMVITEHFAWAHMGKSGGDATARMFAAVPGPGRVGELARHRRQARPLPASCGGRLWTYASHEHPSPARLDPEQGAPHQGQWALAHWPAPLHADSRRDGGDHRRRQRAQAHVRWATVPDTAVASPGASG